MNAAETCPERVWRGGSVWSGGHTVCGKPVKRRGLCGVHARSKELREQREQRYAAENERYGEAQALARRMTADSGIPFRSSGEQIVMSLDAARQVAQRLAR